MPVTSSDFADGERLAVEHGSPSFGIEGGRDLSPQLSWGPVPEGTKSIAVTMFDPDAPIPSGFWHWGLADLPAQTTELPAGAEWSANAPTVQTILDDPAYRSLVLALFDVFHHGHDIRGALGRPGERDTPQAAFVTTVMAKRKRRAWTAAGHPPIQLSTGSGSWRFGAEDAEPIAALATSDFELSRILIGRRSRAQMLAAGWSGDPEPIVDLLPAFGPPVTDLTE